MKILMFSIIIILFASQVYAQPHKAKERISMIKKIKLIEILDLDEKESDKLIVKYSAWEDKIENQLKSFDEAEEGLKKAIKNGNKDEIVKQSNNFIKVRTELINITDKRDTDMKSMLSEIQFAKYLIFEKKFRKELGEQIMKKRRKRD